MRQNTVRPASADLAMSFHVAAVALAFAVPHGVGAGYPGIAYHYRGNVPADVRFLARVEASVQAGFEAASTYRLVRCERVTRNHWSCTARLFFVDDTQTVERCLLPITVRLTGTWYRSSSGSLWNACDLISRSRLFTTGRTRVRR